jgi:hypothetical protein
VGSKFTRRRFLTAVSSGAAYVALTNTVGCEPTRANTIVVHTTEPYVAVQAKNRSGRALGATELINMLRRD